MDNFDELDKMLENIIKEIPGKKKELLEGVGDILEKQVIENIRSRVETHSKNHEKENLIKDVGKLFGSKGGYVAIRPLYFYSNITHNIENGHRIMSGDTVIGFVNGKHFYRDSIIQSEDKILELAKKMIDVVVKDNG